jgi:hypothetical protein
MGERVKVTKKEFLEYLKGEDPVSYSLLKRRGDKNAYDLNEVGGFSHDKKYFRSSKYI